MLPETSKASFSDLQKLTRISHDNVLKPTSFYQLGEELYIVYEYLYLDLFDLFPVEAMDVACIMKQVG
jgi:hypothetical protein